jgi:hypothetical protein
LLDPYVRMVLASDSSLSDGDDMDTLSSSETLIPQNPPPVTVVVVLVLIYLLVHNAAFAQMTSSHWSTPRGCNDEEIARRLITCTLRNQVPRWSTQHWRDDMVNFDAQLKPRKHRKCQSTGRGWYSVLLTSSASVTC